MREWGPSFGTIEGASAVRYELASEALAGGDLETARARLAQIPAGDPLEPKGLLLLAGVHERAGEKEAALACYQRAAAATSSPYAARGLARSADLLFQLGRIDEALAAYERLLASSPPADEEAWGAYQIGNCRFLRGEHPQAGERYDEVLRRWPQSFWAPFAKERLEEMSWGSKLSGRVALP